MLRIMPALHLIRVVIPCLTVAIGLAMLSIASHLIACTNQHRHVENLAVYSALFPIFRYMLTWTQKVEYDNGWYLYTLRLPYLPPNLSLTRPVFLVVTGCICTLLNTTVTALLVKRRTLIVKSTDRKVTPPATSVDGVRILAIIVRLTTSY